MRNILCILFFISNHLPVFSQHSATIYLDKYRFPVDMREHAHSYLVVTADTLPGHYRVNEYYMTDTLKETGTFLDADLFLRNGLVRSYHPNGKIRFEENFEINNRIGTAKAWYPNGQLKEVRVYHKDGYSVQSYYDSLGKALVTDGNGLYTLEEVDEIARRPVVIVGPVKDGLKHGTFKGYLSDGTLYCEEEYVDDKLVKGVSYNNGKEFTYKELEEKAFYERYINHIRKNLRYPASARRLGVDGTVYVRLLINPDYSVEKAMIIKGLTSDIDTETLRVLKDTGFKFGPRVKRGQVDDGELFIAPIKFQLN